MRPIVATVTALLIACVAIAHGEPARPMTTLKIMPLGDSITFGFLSADPNVSGYRGPLYTLLTGAGLGFDFVGRQSNTDGTLPDPDHEGYLGAVAGPTDPTYGLDFKIAGAMAANPPDVILLQIGTNDMTNVPIGGYPRSSAAAPDNLAILLAHIYSLDPSVLTLVSTIPPRTDVAAYGANVPVYNAALPDVVRLRRAAGQRVVLVDAGGRLTAADLLPDGIHPNPGGYANLGAAWYHELLPALATEDGLTRVVLTLDSGQNVTLTARSLP